MDAHRCPICDRRFASKLAVFEHMANTKVHRDALEEIWRLRFLLAEAERSVEIYREQRDALRGGFDFGRCKSILTSVGR